MRPNSSRTSWCGEDGRVSATGGKTFGGTCCGLWLVLISVLCLPIKAAAQSGPPVFISTFGGNAILEVDGTSGSITPLFTGSIGEVPIQPEDSVVGPDGKIYICDSINSRILRMNQDGTQVEVIYNQSTTSCGEATPCPTGPEGPSMFLPPPSSAFPPSRPADLYFNTRGAPETHTGIWKIPGVTSVPFGGTFPAPVQVLTAALTGSTFGEGTVFDNSSPQNLLIVDRSNSRVLRSSPPFSSVSQLIGPTSGLSH